MVGGGGVNKDAVSVALDAVRQRRVVRIPHTLLFCVLHRKNDTRCSPFYKNIRTRRGCTAVVQTFDSISDNVNDASSICPALERPRHSPPRERVETESKPDQ